MVSVARRRQCGFSVRCEIDGPVENFGEVALGVGIGHLGLVLWGPLGIFLIVIL